MQENIVIGHYYAHAEGCSYDVLLDEVDRSTFEALINKVQSDIPECPYEKYVNGNKDKKNDWYYDWKKSTLPILFFTTSIHRPRPTEVYSASGYAVIDIDDNEHKYVSEHPAVCFTNYTKGGTHIFLHTYALRKAQTPAQWQDIYNSVTYEIWYDLCIKYKKDLQIDGNNSAFSQGGFIWNTEWVRSDTFDINWMPSERYLDDNTIDAMYQKDTYHRQPNTPVDRMTKSGRIIKKQLDDNSETISKLADLSVRNKISDRIKKDFKELSYKDFLKKHGGKFKIIMGTEPVFENYTDYEGNTYDMYETKGQMVKIWYPYMQKGDNKKIKEGGRTKSLMSHLCKICQLTSDNLDADNILYNAVYWITEWCENPSTFYKKEIMSCTVSALKTYDHFNEYKFYFDKRTFVTGNLFIDKETGETISMNKGMKISANAKCRKTKRIKIVLDMWKPELSIDENIEHIKSWEYKDLVNLSEKTILNYFEIAKNMPGMREKYEWLDNIVPEKKAVGRQKHQITIQNIETKKVMTFESKKECCEYLKINKGNLSRFLKGNTRLNKTYKVLNA